MIAETTKVDDVAKALSRIEEIQKTTKVAPKIAPVAQKGLLEAIPPEKGIIPQELQPLVQEIKTSIEEFKGMPKFASIKEPNKILPISTIPDEIVSAIKLSNKEVFISRLSLKHIVEQRGVMADEIINSIPDVLSNPTKIADNSVKRPNSFLFAKMNGKAKGVVLEVIKTPESNRVVSAFYIYPHTYNKLVDISGRAHVPPSAITKISEGGRMRISDLQKPTKLSIAKSKEVVKGVYNATQN